MGLEQVLLMAPENIHMNSFMFEPILDMSLQEFFRCLKAGVPHLC